MRTIVIMAALASGCAGPLTLRVTCVELGAPVSVLEADFSDAAESVEYPLPIDGQCTASVRRKE